jgi:hypothetical protein
MQRNMLTRLSTCATVGERWERYCVLTVPLCLTQRLGRRKVKAMKEIKEAMNAMEQGLFAFAPEAKVNAVACAAVSLLANLIKIIEQEPQFRSQMVDEVTLWIREDVFAPKAKLDA